MDTLYTARLHGFPNLSRQHGGMGEQAGVFTEESVLSLLIVLGSSISLVGLVFAFITYSLFSDLRNLSGTTLMNLLAALFMTQLLYVVGVGGVPDSELCIALAFSLQYVRLCVLCWMLTMAHHMHMQFRTSLHLNPITDNAIGKHFLRYSLFAWGIPALLLGASALIQYHDKGGKLLDTASLKSQNCWFLDRNAFIYALLVPSTIFITTTLYYLVRSALVARYVISMQVEPRTREKMRRKRMLHIALFAKITILLAVVMILAALSKLATSETAWIGYHVGQGLQGILVAMLVTCNCQILKLYTGGVKKTKSRASNYKWPVYVNAFLTRGGGSTSTGAATMSKSTSLQLLTWEPAPDPV